MFPAWIMGLTVADFVLPFVGLVACYLFVRWVHPQMKKFSRLQDDLLGVPGRPGFDSKPGIMERVSNIEEDVAEVKAEQSTAAAKLENLSGVVEKIQKEVTPNHGSSSHDSIMNQLAANQEVNLKVLALLAKFLGEGV